MKINNKSCCIAEKSCCKGKCNYKKNLVSKLLKDISSFFSEFTSETQSVILSIIKLKTNTYNTSSCEKTKKQAQN